MQGPDNLIQNPLQKNLPIFMRIQNICIPKKYIVLVYHHVCIQIDVYIQPTKEINIRNEGRVNCNKRQMSKSLAYIISLYYIKLHIYSLYILSILNCKVLVIVLDTILYSLFVYENPCSFVQLLSFCGKIQEISLQQELG